MVLVQVRHDLSFSSEDGTISAFRGNPIITVVPNANAPAHGAIYKGLAIDSRTAGTQLYATDFHNGKIDVFDTSFHLITLAETSPIRIFLPALHRSEFKTSAALFT